jgi:hypothetical protein
VECVIKGLNRRLGQKEPREGWPALEDDIQNKILMMQGIAMDTGKMGFQAARTAMKRLQGIKQARRLP